jgi:cysteine desulfurase/selenocysteine lyase
MNKEDFALLSRNPGTRDLVYLDNAATTQKPDLVINAITDYYRSANANVHRAAHALSAEATRLFEASRENVRQFINAEAVEEIIFTRGTTESINLVANSHASRLGPGDEVLISHMEHHSNIVPWQMLTAATGATLKACNVTSEGELDLEDFSAKLTRRTRIVALSHVSNALGTVNPVQMLTRQAHAAGAVVLLDGAQAMAHLPVDVRALECDFYAFSGHKMYGPTGIGVLYGKRALLEELPPWQGGGEMIEHVAIEKTSYNVLPYKFEAGTPNIAGAIGLSAAINYLGTFQWSDIEEHEQQLLNLTISQLKQMEQLRIIGEPLTRAAAVSFVAQECHPHDIGTLLDQQDIAVRTGHHCAMPLMQMLGVSGTVRASFALYNTEDDVAKLITGVRKALSFI